MANMFASLRGRREWMVSAAVLVIIILLSFLRVKFYGDPALSIAGNDTISYVEASQVPLFSAEIFTGRRLLTTNLVYKMLEPETGYEILINGSIETTRRGFQPGFDRIVIFQLALSLIGWGILAWLVSRTLRNSWIKITSAVVILAFAFTPHMADWDSILMSESLTFSLFALQLAILIKMVFDLYRDPDAKITGWLIVWGVVSFFWVFLRDTNVFTALMTLGMIAVLLVSPKYRKKKTLIGTMIFLALMVVLGLVTARASVRTVVQIRNIYKDDIFPNPGVVAVFQGMGMPVDSFFAPEFEPWLQTDGASTLFRFMLTHPGYVATKLWNDFPDSFTEIKQTYFNARDLNPARDILFEIGNALHPENTTPFLGSILTLLGILLLAGKNIGDSRPWAWLGLWLFFTATLTLVPTILGDTWALNRHALYSTMIFRLTMWLFPIIIIDVALRRETALVDTPS
ncbi:MAG: hypothetical protein EDM79_03745 [Chloroflexi bacterium]|nr:MAG: hypothetical protein EDM79_03745 [Chloroflexota bacterium]MCE7859702.1 hypothetical protein [Chloroflexi bacterium CFX2]